MTVPAAAENSGVIGPGSGELKDDSRPQPNTGAGTGPGESREESPPIDEGTGPGGEEQPSHNDAVGDLQPEGPIGPVGSTGVPTYEAVWMPGETIPTAVTILADDANVELVTLGTEDRSLFAALVVIDNHEAPAEYRFENAVPDGHTAKAHPDGSVSFVDIDGTESGGIAAPWALDANGEEVPTRYILDGTTLIQIVDHEGAAYPVVADPAWVVAAVLVVRIVAPTVSTVAAACARAYCGHIAATTGSALYDAVKPSGGSGGGRPTNTCNMRNRTGC
ncbi:hypothetical protein [Candidatus Poriferisodalis sp.]|uniref:hypothetical protein n=1 Tax=Candidatus Poriferisodalis sp. TaxID=3101277 RepID=UPI003B02A47F